MALFVLVRAFMTTNVAPDELRDLQREYLRDTRDTLQLLRQHGDALTARKRFKTSFPVLLYLAHQLKGSGGSLGFPRISQVAASLGEELNRFLDDAEVVRPTPQELSSKVSQLAGELESAVSDGEQQIRV